MKIGCVYVNAGKGHYIPAKAISDELTALGTETEMLDFFKIIDAPKFDALNQNIWRWELKFPKIEQALNARADKTSSAKKKLKAFASARYQKNFSRWIENNHVDAFICTHYIPSLILSEFSHDLGLHIPVFAYSSDVFTTPLSGLGEHLEKFYISSEEGLTYVAATGFPQEKIALTSFPIQSSCINARYMTKQEARNMLKISDMFTLLINLGGEGIGTISVIEGLEKQGAEVQIMLVGGMNEKDKEKFTSLQNRCKTVKVIPVGFVNNIYQYLYACDIVVGKAGINAMLEAMYLKRPFLVTTVYYTVKAAADYFERHKIGWYAPKVDQQIRIISEYLQNPELLKDTEQAFSKVPISFGAKAIAKDLIETLQNKRI